MAAKARAEVRHVRIGEQAHRAMRLTILVPDTEAEGTRILKEVLKDFEDTLNRMSNDFSSYVAFTNGIKTGQTVRVGVRSPKAASTTKASAWQRFKAWFLGIR